MFLQILNVRQVCSQCSGDEKKTPPPMGESSTIRVDRVSGDKDHAVSFCFGWKATPRSVFASSSTSLWEESHCQPGIRQTILLNIGCLLRYSSNNAAISSDDKER